MVFTESGASPSCNDCRFTHVTLLVVFGQARGPHILAKPHRDLQPHEGDVIHHELGVEAWVLVDLADGQPLPFAGRGVVVAQGDQDFLVAVEAMRCRHDPSPADERPAAHDAACAGAAAADLQEGDPGVEMGLGDAAAHDAVRGTLRLGAGGVAGF